MKVWVPVTITAVLVGGALIAADQSYTGKWKLNPAKSDFGETTVTYEQLAGGEMKATAAGQSYTFKADGKDYPTPWGGMESLKAKDTNTWEVIDKANGKVLATSTMKLSADGKTLTMDSKRMKASGETSDDTAVYQRVSGGPGLAGKWKTKNMKSSSPGVMELAAKGSDGLALKFVDENGTCDAKFDGKDYPATGTLWPSGWTCAISKNGASGFDVTWKKDGKPMFKSSFTVASDGKTLTEIGTAQGNSEKTKAIYDRQM